MAKEEMVKLKIREDYKGTAAVSGYFPGIKVDKGQKARDGSPVQSDLRVKPGETFEVPKSEAQRHLRTRLVEVALDFPEDADDAAVA